LGVPSASLHEILKLARINCFLVREQLTAIQKPKRRRLR
jgi:hypothetical protein